MKWKLRTNGFSHRSALSEFDIYHGKTGYVDRYAIKWYYPIFHDG
jgi:hypothetical protein